MAVSAAIGDSVAGMGAGFGSAGGDLVFGTLEQIEETLPLLVFTATSASGYETSQDVALPAGAVVTKAVVSVAGQAPPFATPVGGIATVRAAAGAPASPSSLLVVDFGVLRTVSSVEAPSAIRSIKAWRGTSFDQAVPLSSTTSAHAEFTEVQTERLLVELASATSPSTFADEATVTTSTPPADLELSVSGARAWFRVGPTPEGFTEQVDVTAPLQTALDSTAAGSDGTVHVPVTLRARIPGQLELSLVPPVGYLRTRTVAFPGTTTTRSFDEEGQIDVPLELPEESADWTIHRVLATVTAIVDGPQRTLSPVGPDRSADAELVLDPDRRLVVQIPTERLAPFAQIAGVRLSVQPRAGGVELGGALLTDDAGAPGAPLPKGTFTPITLDEGAEPAFVTLPLGQPMKVAPEAPLWFSLAATRGRAVVGLAPGGAPVGDAVLRRVMPNGTVRAMSSPVGVRTDVLQLRIVGVAPPLAPIDVVSVDLVGGGTEREPVDPVLAATGLVSLAVVPPATRPGLSLRLTATAATTVTIGPVVIAYVDAADATPGGSP